ncbi:MAG: S28 family serine protease [Myxococcota bacterium]
MPAWLACCACSGSPPSELSDAGAADLGAPDLGTPDLGTEDAGAPDVPSYPDASAPDSGPEQDILELLRAVPGLTVQEVSPGFRNTRAFVLGLEQPEDHGDPGGPQFTQRMVLVHRTTAAPMVMFTTGYDFFGDPEQWTSTWTEPAEILGANQLTVEHRFFGLSIAPQARWQFLTIEQSANDTHRIKELLSTVYGGDWVGTGVSKGGMTTIFHHRFFPDDFAAIVPYVAPISFDTAAGRPDHRYVDWLANIGPADGVCRARILDMKVEVCERRSEMADYLLAHFTTPIPLTHAAMEAYATVPAFSYHWLFWQYWATPAVCAALPPRGGPIQDLAAWFREDPNDLFPLPLFDPGLDPYTYQAQAELGEPEVVDTEIETITATINYHLLPRLLEPPQMPWGATPIYDPAPMQAVDQFLRTEARHVLAVYGAWDSWTGGKVTLDPAKDNAVIEVPAHVHDAQLSFLPVADRNQATSLLRSWLPHHLRDPGAHKRSAEEPSEAGQGQQRIAELVRAREFRAGSTSSALRRIWRP